MDATSVPLCSCPKYGLHREMVEPQFREPFIIKGYRKPYMKALDCLKSPFVFYNNEAINVWTHFLAFLIFLLKFITLFTKELPIDHHYYWPLMSYAIGILGFCLMSSIAHTFNSISPAIRNTCFYLDYAAIGIYSVGAGQSFYFYCRPIEGDTIILSPYYFAALSMFTSSTSTVACCLSRHHWHSVKYLLRTCSMILPFLINASPYLYRLMICKDPVGCDYRSLPYFFKHCILYFLAAVANVTRFPERLIPGCFDALGQSHHLMHIFTAVGAGIQFESIKIELVNRKHLLEKTIIQHADVNTFHIMLSAVLVNIGIALVFGLATSNKTYLKKKEKQT